MWIYIFENVKSQFIQKGNLFKTSYISVGSKIPSKSHIYVYIFFSVYLNGEEGNSKIPSKRKRDELTPTILVDQTSTSTLVGEENNETTHCSRQLGSSEKK